VEFAVDNAKVVVVGRDTERVCSQALDHGAAGALWARCDVTDKARVDGMVATARDRFGAIDVLLNCVAAVGTGSHDADGRRPRML
jgi:2-hydroxycyclohexanecarboxyl-CoA dehydrogenase